MTNTNSDLASTSLSTTESPTYDAQQMTEAIALGDEKAPKVDVSSDYEASKEFSVSEIDRTDAGAEAAAAVTSTQFELSTPTEVEFKAEPTGEPSDFLDMAKSVSSIAADATPINDDLMQRALELGQPSH